MGLPSVRGAELFHIEHQSFEVFAFGVVDADGVVGGLGELVEDFHFAAGVGCGCENGLAEKVFGHDLRAGESEDDPSRLDDFDAFPV